MSIEFKARLDQLCSPIRFSDDPTWEGLHLERHLICYQFLRNSWGSYFHQRDNLNLEDKFDHVNKIVGMIKAQVRMMTKTEAELQPPYQELHATPEV